eukprot:TRINITY_DN1764_c0_g2_i12.p1 TRINITY_DN1764_c0_g2~~TRINITY_DN1764_c0_g2_i12.p1  ORF type:complete len:1468 (-),score=350.67 TRINITY_DN1764_c0_g2_i12:359-4762(-)
MHIVSEGTSDAFLTIETASGGRPMIVLAERENATSPREIQLFNDGVDDRFVIGDGVGNEFLSIQADTAYTQVTGEALFSSGATIVSDLVVGGYDIRGPRKLQVESSDDLAEVNIVAGRGSEAHLVIRAPANQDSFVTLAEDSHSINLVRDGVSNRFLITDENATELISVSPSSGDMVLRGELKIGHDEDAPNFIVDQFTGDVGMQGDLVVGGDNQPGARAATIQSRDSTAKMSIISGNSSDASMLLSVPDSGNALITFTEGTDSFLMLNEGTTKRFKITDGTEELLSITKGDGNTYIRGSLKIGHDEANPMFVADSNNGDTTMRGDMVVGGPYIPGARSMTIRSQDDTAALHLISGNGSDSELSVLAGQGKNAVVTLAEGSNRFHLLNDGSDDKFILSDGSNELLGIRRGTGDTYVRGQLKVGRDPTNPMFVAESSNGDVGMQGDLTIGGERIRGARAATIQSKDAAASLHLRAGGTSDAGIKVTSPQGRNTSVTLKETNGTAFHIINKGFVDRLVIADNTHDLMVITPVVGDVRHRGDFTVGGEFGSAGPKAMTIRSLDAAASLNLISANQSNAELKLAAPTGQDAVITLAEGSNRFHLLNDGSDDRFILTDGSNELLGVYRGTGDTYVRGQLKVGRDPTNPMFVAESSNGDVGMQGDLTIGGERIRGARAATIQSKDAAASLHLRAGGTSDAGIKVTSPQGRNTSVTLKETNGTAFHIINKGFVDRLVIADNTHDLMVITPVVGDVRHRGDFTVGGEFGSAGPKAMTIRSLDAAASLNLISANQSNAELKLAAPTGQDAVITLAEGSNRFHLLNDGSDDKFILSDGSNELLGIRRGTGDTYVRGQLKVGRDPTNPMFVAESSNGDVGMQGDLTIGGERIRGARAATIQSSDSDASLSIIANVDASMTLHAARDRLATITMTEGNHSFLMENRGADDQFVITDGEHVLMSMNRTTGNTHFRGQITTGIDPFKPALLSNNQGETQMRGDLTIGGAHVPGVRSATIQSPDGEASLHLIGGNSSNAFLEIETSANNQASLDLYEGDNVFSIANVGAENKFVVSDGAVRLLTVARETGHTDLRGELQIGNDWTNPVFAVRDAGSTGYTVMRGDLTVGGANTTGERAATIRSNDSAASLNVISGGGNAGVVISSPNGWDSWITLQENNGTAFHMVNDGVENQFILADDSTKLLVVEPLTGNTQIAGSVDVGHTLEVRRDMLVGGTLHDHTTTVQSLDGTADLLVQSGGANDASLVIKTPRNQTAAISLQETDGVEIHLMSRGANDTFVVSDGAMDLLTVYPNTGNMVVKGELEVNNITTIRGNLTVYGDIYSHCDGHRWEQGSKHCYKHFPNVSTFNQARLTCSKWHGYLASLTSLEENQFAHDAVHWSPGTTDEVWIGYSDAQGSQMEFEWLTGEIAVDGDQQLWENWASGSPSDEYGEKDCALMHYGSSGLWRDESCMLKHGFICERDI